MSEEKYPALTLSQITHLEKIFISQMPFKLGPNHKGSLCPP